MKIWWWLLPPAVLAVVWFRSWRQVRSYDLEIALEIMRQRATEEEIERRQN